MITKEDSGKGIILLMIVIYDSSGMTKLYPQKSTAMHIIKIYLISNKLLNHPVLSNFVLC